MKGSVALQILDQAGIPLKYLGSGYYEAEISAYRKIKFNVDLPLAYPAMQVVLDYTPLGEAMK